MFRFHTMPFLLAQVGQDAPQTANKTPGDVAAELEPPPQNVHEAVSTIYQSLLELWQDFLRRLPLLVAGILLLLVTWVVARLVGKVARRLAQRMRFRISLQELCAQVGFIATWCVGIVTSAVVVFPGMTPARVLTVLGLGSIAIGFAFKDIVENFLAGVLILWRFPFEPGDFIKCGEVEGRVERTTVRLTTIRQVDGQLIVMPNAQLLKTPVRVMTSQLTRRITIMVGVAYHEDVDQSREVISKAVGKCERVNHDQPIEIFAREFAESSINFEVTWWTGATPLEERQSRDEVVSAVKRALEEAGIEIPFPYLTLTFKGDVPVKQLGQNAES